jgi:phage repressor protein C with HTH and peptisase S24 domain
METLGIAVMDRPVLCQRLANARKEMSPKPSQAKMAKMIEDGLDQSTYKMYETRTPLPNRYAERVAQLTGKNQYWFVDERAPEYVNGYSERTNDLATNVRHAAATVPDRSGLPKDLPVWGTVEAGEGAFYMDTGSSVDTVRRPTGLANTKDAYAIYVEGTSMEPVHDSGDLLYVNPHRKPQPGRDCVIVLRKRDEGDDQRYLLKRLVRRTPTKWVFKQFNPEREIHLDDARVESVHLVLKNAEINI